MHTVFVLAVGFGLLGACTLLGRAVGGAHGVATAALVFLPVWLAGAGINMYLGIKRAGYALAEEAPIFLLVYALPSAAAVVTWWKLR
jgi:hypothetical protein